MINFPLMKNKRYTSYAEIDRDLEILQLEREIQRKKVGLHLTEAKNHLNPSYVFTETIKSVVPSWTESGSAIFKLVLPWVLKYFFIKKRG
jgi:hypothetical protein